MSFRREDLNPPAIVQKAVEFQDWKAYAYLNELAEVYSRKEKESVLALYDLGKAIAYIKLEKEEQGGWQRWFEKAVDNGALKKLSLSTAKRALRIYHWKDRLDDVKWDWAQGVNATVLKIKELEALEDAQKTSQDVMGTAVPASFVHEPEVTKEPADGKSNSVAEDPADPTPAASGSSELLSANTPSSGVDEGLRREELTASRSQPKRRTIEERRLHCLAQIRELEEKLERKRRELAKYTCGSL